MTTKTTKTTKTPAKTPAKTTAAKRAPKAASASPKAPALKQVTTSPHAAKASIAGRGIFDPAKLISILKKRREQKGLSPRQLSLRLGMNPQTVGTVEARNSDMRLGTLIAICRELELKPSHLLEGMGE